MSILPAGGAGYFRVCLVLDWPATNDKPIMSRDDLLYAGSLENLQGLEGYKQRFFMKDSANAGVFA